MSEATYISTYEVIGMACRSCAATVTEEVELVDGVTSVTVDVASGSMTVTSERESDPIAVRAAVEEAGYELTTPQGLSVGSSTQP
ncbi:heavy-metal-associated domain-containing protein [Streptomyces johnsoniae]|uniref:Heavy metal-associated domain-containing protein n=1 Tax=Streptomyces johnsoniae TaxID=3075532 RepID=A0ABU2RXB6_9ACTN|nr:heavy metal-associated domain-containing protein [Streptomyces sp. DSM 41886]MDT0441355.1 heavy metal-associated domain-containing protein [Streptomyces sp. DSM 41886]